MLFVMSVRTVKRNQERAKRTQQTKHKREVSNGWWSVSMISICPVWGNKMEEMLGEKLNLHRYNWKQYCVKNTWTCDITYYRKIIENTFHIFTMSQVQILSFYVLIYLLNKNDPVEDALLLSLFLRSGKYISKTRK